MMDERIPIDPVLCSSPSHGQIGRCKGNEDDTKVDFVNSSLL